MIEAPSKKRILILGQIPPPFGGQAINIQKMVQVLHKHHFNYQLIPLDFSESLNDMGAFNFKKALKLIRIFCTLLYKLLVYRPHLVYYPPAGPTMNAVYRDFILLFPIKLFGVKRIFHFHAGGLASLYDGLAPWAKQVYRYVYFKPDYAICLSKAGRIDPEFLQAQQIDIIPSGVEAFTSGAGSSEVGTSETNRENLNVESAKNPSKEHFLVLFAGLCSTSKGILDFIEVLRICRQKNKRIVGKVMGKAFSSIEEQALSNAEKEGILVYEGILSGKEKEAAFLGSSAFLFPSVFESENFPTVIIEAFAAGLPVVSTEWRGIPDLVNHVKNGFIHPPHAIAAMAQSILELAENNELHKQLSAQAKSDFETNYTMGNFEALIVAYFKKVQ
ncbi:MAG: glycosyltransferase family 4 protein [Sediminibacterium sp.]|uniref:glycosyltransferase family 4 protein n=1 Tax=Sediminibacterium sp. TaxID=1917865 RepID=UPI002725C558|nr:glycosyltransferase family 4 protein [Sediminibacterium sp.]MDO8997118.1 glycosyltransferase family 4 protein [Sediminibacterium sp.]